MIETIDKAVVAGLRVLPDLRGKPALALRWKALRERSRPLAGAWELRMRDGSVMTAPRGSLMTWTVASVGHWDRHVMELLSQYVAPDSLVLDIGASLGLWTVPLARIARPKGALIWCFEPNPENIHWLGANIERNGLGDIAEVRGLGLGAHAGTAPLSYREHGGGNGAIGVATAEGSVAVSVERLDDLELPRRVSFMKLDVEGFELEVFRGAHETIERDRPVIFGEFNAEWLRLRGEDLAGYLVLLAGLDYEVFVVDERRSAAWRPKDTPSLRQLVAPFSNGVQNLLLVPASVRSH